MTRVILLSAVSVVLLAGGLALSTAPVAAGEDGKTVFTTYCATCHGDTGKGDGPASAALDPKPAAFASEGFFDERPDDHLRKVIKEGGPSVGKSPLMAPWGSVLSDAQVEAVIAHIKTLR